ncbi:MAG: hypothetical protein K1X89_20230 [Myxococcaceae bacterium]|nr:hypothetical protein [Myxococcaceae bacterium]
MLSLVLAGVLAVEATAPPPVPVRTEQEQLQADIDAINTRLRLLDTNWPIPSAVSLYVGIGLASTGFLGEGMLLFTGAVLGSRGRSLPVGLHVGMLVVAGLGLVLSAIGIVTGVRAAGPAREERERLTEDRRRLEDALRASKRQSPMQLELPPASLLLQYAGTF